MSKSPPQPPPFVGSEFGDADFERLRDLLLARRSFDLGMYKDRCIKRRIAARVRAVGLGAAAPYLERLEHDEKEIDALLAALSIHVSQFFRNPSTFGVLEQEILPRLVVEARAGPSRQLRLWSVGCATGEEPYSLALLVDELAPQGVDIEILGSDVSPAVLELAAVGRYDAQRLQEVPEAVRERYFLPEGSAFRLDAGIRRRVRFVHHDILGQDQYPAARLILCRNVLIYFSRADQERILRGFARSLGAGGYLVLGRAETLLGETRQLFAPEYPAERIYRCRPHPDPADHFGACSD